MRTLRQCLVDCDFSTLRVIAAQWGVELLTNRHDDAVNTLAARLSDPLAQAEIWPALSEAERKALSALVASGGEIPSGTFARRYGEIRPMGPGRLERERPWEAPINTAESLWYRGLIYKAFDQGPGALQEVTFIPRELASGLTSTPVVGVTPALPAQSEPEAMRCAGAQLADDLSTVLIHLYAEPVYTRLDQALPQRRLRALDHQLRDRTPIRLELLMHLAARLALVKPDTRPLRLDPQAATRWLKAPTLQQQRVLFESWRDSSSWNDLWRVPTLRCEETGSWRNDPVIARRTLGDFLTALDADAWYRLEDLVQAIHTTSPDFQRPGGNYDTWYIRDAVTNDYLAGYASWEQVEGALLRFLMTGPLHWLGVVDLDADATLFRVTLAGWWLLGVYVGDVPELSEDRTFLVQADGQIHIGAGRRYDRFQLARVADWVNSGEMYTYRLAPGSLERARAQRIGIGRILEFLEGASETAVPAALANALRRWSTRGTPV